MANVIVIPEPTNIEPPPPQKNPIWMNLAKVATPFAAFVLFIVLIVIAVNAIFSKKEVANYQIKPWKVTRCPFPMGLKVEQERYKPGTVWSMARNINKELAPRLELSTLIFMDATQGAPIGRPVIKVTVAKQEDVAPGEPCSFPNIGPKAPIDPGAMALGYFSFQYSKVNFRLRSGKVVMCDQKFKRLVDIVKKPTWLKLYPDWWGRYVKHELMHALMGAGHPNWNSDVTHASAPNERISESTIKILKRIYDPVCKGK